MSRFSIDINNVSDERVLIPNGDYPIRITKADIKQATSDKDGKKTNYIQINMQATVRDEDVQKALNQDEPKCFPSVFVMFDPDWNILETGNEQFGKFRKAAGFTDNSKFEDGTEDAETMKEYVGVFFANIAKEVVGMDFLAKIGVRTYNDQQQNDIKSLAPLPE